MTVTYSLGRLLKNIPSSTTGTSSVIGSGNPLGFASSSQPETFDFTTAPVPQQQPTVLPRSGYESWKSSLPSRLRSEVDYDLKGYYNKYGASKVKGEEHLTDEFKLPNHPTFSTESIYYNDQTKNKAGEWKGDVYVPFDEERQAYDEKNDRYIDNPRRKQKPVEPLTKFPSFTPTLGTQQQVGLTPQVGTTGGFMQDIQANIEGRYSPNQEAMSQKLNKINQMYDKAQGKPSTQQAQQATRTQGNIDIDIPSSEREGNRAEYVYNKLLNGVGELTSAFGDLAIQMSPLTPQAGKTAVLSNYRKETAGQLRDYLKNNIGAEVDKGLEAKYDNEFLTSSIGGLANSIPAMALPPAIRTAAFVLQGYDMGLRSVDANDQNGQLDDLTKTIYAAGVGTASGLLEKLGFDKLLGAATPSVATTLTNKALREVYEATNGKVTADALTRFLDTNIKDFAEQYAKRGVRALEGFGIEAATGGAQEVANIGSEYLLNKATGKSVFDTKDMSSWDGFVDNLKRVAYAAAQEGVGGGIIRGVLNPKARAAIETNEQTLEGINNELERTDIPDSVKEVLVKRKIELQSEIDAGVQEAERNYNRLNPTQQERVNELGERIVAFDEAIADPNISEEVKKDLQQQSDTVQKEIESIKPETKEIITPIISSSDVVVGDEVQLENGKRGTVTEINGENIKFDLADGGTITTSKPEFLGMSKVNVEEQVTEAPVVEETVTEEVPFVDEVVETIEPVADEVKPSEVATKEVVEKPIVSEERTEEVIAKADTDLQTLKKVKDKTKKHEASLKRLTEAKSKGEISEKQFNDYKKKFDQVLSESQTVEVADQSERIPTEELTQTQEETPDAVQESKPTSVDVREQATDGERVGEGDTQRERPTQEVPSEKVQQEKIKQIQEKRQSVKDRISQKLKDQRGNLSSGFDPSLLKDFIELGSTYIEEGVVKASDFIKRFREDYKDMGFDESTITDEDITKEVFDKLVDPTTTLRNADVAERRKDYGFEERVMPDKVSNAETEAKADSMLSEGYDVEDLIDRINEGKPVTAEESVVLAKYQGVLQDKLIEYNRRMENNVDAAVGSFERLVEQRNKAIDDLIRAYDASEIAGTISARALQARRIAVLQDYSLANLFIRKRKAQGNVELTEEQKQEITNTYNKLKETEQKLADKIAQLDAKTAELNALNATKRMKRDIEADRRKNRRNQTKDALREERKSIFSEISKLANKSRGEVSANPIPVEMIPLIGRLARNYYADGVVSLEQIVDNIHKDLVDYVDGVTKRDVRDAISGYGLDSRATRDELRQQIQDLKTQAKLISQIEDAEAGLSKVRPEQRKAASEEVEMLRARLKDLTRSEDQLHALKNRLNKQIKETQKKLDNRDYSKKEVFETELDDEARKLQDAYRKIKFDFEVAVQKDLLAHRTKWEKYRDITVDVLNIPRSLMATADFSAPLRQGVIPTVSNPLMAGRAFSESLKQWASKGRADRWLADLKESDGYQLMKDSKLYIAENNNAQVAAREEEFSSNLAGKIPLIGKLVDASERNYNGFLNKMRVDLFTRGVDVLQDQGMTYANSPDAYKALARYINSSTGRGDLGALNTAAPLLNSMFFSPRLMASRLGLLTAAPLRYKNVPKAIKMMYVKDMARFVGFGLSVLALAAANGADVEPDPRSPDFGKIKRGDTRWDIWAGFQQYIRFFTQFGFGQKKSSASGNITPLDGTSYNKETRLSTLAAFIRGKFAPVPALVTNALSGSNVIGEPFSLENEVPKMLAPLVYQSIYESAQIDGWPFAIGATGIPSMLGVGVQTYGVNNFLQKGVDDKLVELLSKKKAVAIEPKEGDKEIYDIDTGEERDMTTAEYKKYYDVWSASIKANLKDNYKEYEKMSVGEFEKAFRSIKMNATKEAKAVVSGVTQGEKTIREGDTTFELTPKQIELRQSIKKDFIKENGKDILEGEREKALAEGKSAGEADRLAKKKLESEANAYSKQVFLEKEEEGNNTYKLNKKE